MTYSCIECVDRPTFPSIPSLARHRTTTHQITSPLPKEPPMPDKSDANCPDCHATFRNAHGLAVHRRRAHGIYPTKAAATTDPVNVAIERLTTERDRIAAKIGAVDQLTAERDRLTRAIVALEAAR